MTTTKLSDDDLLPSWAPTKPEKGIKWNGLCFRLFDQIIIIQAHG